MKPITKNRIRQSLCRWCFDAIPLDTLAQQAAAMGFQAIDLVEPADWPVLRRHGLVCSMTPTHALTRGLNDPANHPECLAKIHAAIDATACPGAGGGGNVICFSGNRRPGLSDDQGLIHTAAAIRQVLPHAQEKNVTLCIELLNSKVDHPGYMCDHSAWGAALVAKFNSPHFKLLYDIYHMQVQEGDIIATIRRLHPLIAHYHTAGVPGRHELDASQELNYPAIMRTIAATGFQGYVAQEFVPTADPLTSLAQAAQICDV
jgi:hydroxypyruvate isomerase